MEQRRLGAGGPLVSALGLGCMALSGRYGPADDAESLAMLHAALDDGLTLLDTGDFYGVGHNETLIGQALRGRERDQITVSVKFGVMCEPGGGWGRLDARPEAVRNSLAYTLHRLGTDHVDVYRPARLDPQVPIEETVGAISDLVTAGYVRHIGLSEVDVETLRRAHATHPISDLQVEYSLLSRDIEAEVLPFCRRHGIGITAYGVLSRGLLTGSWTRPRGGAEDIRGGFPRFQGANLEHNLSLARELHKVAASKGTTAARLAIAWVLAQGEDIVPLIGARTRAQLTESLLARRLDLTRDDLEAVERALPAGAAVGDRYPSRPMVSSDNEQ
ncbi:aldo/keto reductase [Actinomadura chokoriensis]|uniref:Aldo/keto reductase n=1 Tax=Actinomadura chokoriensis TaxID=454156 RepID=A0ABV4R4P5_9ACTN